MGELYNHVLIEPVVIPVGRGPIQAKEDSVDVHGEIIGETCFHGNWETHEFRVWSHWMEPIRFAFSDFKLEDGRDRYDHL